MVQSELLDKALERLRTNDKTPTKLDLDSNNIGVEGASALANALEVNKTSLSLICVITTFGMMI